MMNKNRRSPDLQNASSPPPDDKLHTIGGAGRALAGMLLTILGLVIGLIGGFLVEQSHGLGKDILGEDATVASVLALKIAGFLVLGLGLLLGAAGVFLLGKRGKALTVRLGCFLFVAGIATYLVDLVLDQGPNKIARLVGLLSALLGIILIAAANGWLTGGRGGIFDD